MNWLRRTAVTALPAVALVVLAAAPALAAAPSVSYSETGTCGNGACTTHITIDSNPNNVGIRAWELCHSGTIYLGSWQYNVGETSNTASCGTGNPVTSAGFDYRKSAPIRVDCFFFGNSRTGFC
jgi:hypothetical protein